MIHTFHNSVNIVTIYRNYVTICVLELITFVM